MPGTTGAAADAAGASSVALRLQDGPSRATATISATANARFMTDPLPWGLRSTPSSIVNQTPAARTFRAIAAMTGVPRTAACLRHLRSRGQGGSTQTRSDVAAPALGRTAAATACALTDEVPDEPDLFAQLRYRTHLRPRPGTRPGRLEMDPRRPGPARLPTRRHLQGDALGSQPAP